MGLLLEMRIEHILWDLGIRGSVGFFGLLGGLCHYDVSIKSCLSEQDKESLEKVCRTDVGEESMLVFHYSA